jgi:hypothetical protein
MEDRVKFVGIILVRNLWYEDHSRGFQRYLPVSRRQSNFHKVERPKLI